MMNYPTPNQSRKAPTLWELILGPDGRVKMQGGTRGRENYREHPILTAMRIIIGSAMFLAIGIYIYHVVTSEKTPHEYTITETGYAGQEQTYTTTIPPVVPEEEWKLEKSETIEYREWHICERNLEEGIRRSWNPQDHEVFNVNSPFFRQVIQENHKGPHMSYKQVLICDDNLYIVEDYSYRRR